MSIAAHRISKDYIKTDSADELTVDLESSVELEKPVKAPATSGFFSRGALAVALPEVIQEHLTAVPKELKVKILKSREAIYNSFTGESQLLAIAGPAYVESEEQIKSCAKWLASLDVPSTTLLRTNLSKVKNGATFEIRTGLPQCRQLLAELAEKLPIAGQTADTITPQYFSDLYTLSTVSSTLAESQLHRELASGMSYLVGFHAQDADGEFSKEMYAHKVTSALDAVYALLQPHRFLSVTKLGTVAVIGTAGNSETFVILVVNSEVNEEEMQSLVEKVKSYGNLQSPKIMLDVGRLTEDEYEHKKSVVDGLLRRNRGDILGLVIDTGAEYDNNTPEMKNAELLMRSIN